MPRLGESVTEGTIARWLKEEGEEVAKDEPLCEVDTDKVGAELPSPVAGRLEKHLVAEGTTVEVGTEIALVAVASEHGERQDKAPPREDATAEAPTEEFPAAGTVAQPVAAAGNMGWREASGRAPVESGAVESAETLRIRRSSPVVRRLAAEHGLEIEHIPGTGIGGRVTKKDIERYVEEREALSEAPLLAEPGRIEVHDGDRILEITSVRRATADRLSRSKREAPHAWTMVEADVTGLVALRSRIKEEFEKSEGVRLTYLTFIAKAVTESLSEHPLLNAAWDHDRIVLRRRINIGIAVNLEDALVVPVIHGADELNLQELARKIDDVVGRTRTGALSDTTGGTFTVNNPGALGSVVSTPIINHPQAAILSAEAIVKRPVVVEGDAIAVRSMMNLEVSFDHRVLDGGAALGFLNAVKRRLEELRVEEDPV
ncbi:branched-chain alpha-keto dehydrogenase complex dihydrolipoyllysine-residue (2-methylpropanoyl)transferase [soil metagenome]